MTVPRQSDAEAFSEFVAAGSGSLFRTAYLAMGDYQLAQDLLQESLTKTYLAWSRLREVDSAEAYTRRVIVTTSITWRRRRSFGERPGHDLPDPSTPDPTALLLEQDELWVALPQGVAAERVVGQPAQLGLDARAVGHHADPRLRARRERAVHQLPLGVHQVALPLGDELRDAPAERRPLVRRAGLASWRHAPS